MIQIPEKYKERMIKSYGKEGEDWLRSLPGLIKKYENEFQIEKLKQMPKTSVNFLLSRVFE